MGRARSLALSVTALLAPAGKLKAQSAQAISLQVSGLYNGLFGNAFGAFSDGGGVEGQIRYTPGALSLGAGVQYTVHDCLAPACIDQDEKAQLFGGFFEPRYRIHTGSNVVAPYISARFSWVNVGFSGDDLSISSDYIQLNGGGGILYRLGPRFNLDLGATFGYNRLGEGTIDSEEFGRLGSFEANTGTNVVVRLGLAVGLGG